MKRSNKYTSYRCDTIDPCLNYKACSAGAVCRLDDKLKPFCDCPIGKQSFIFK